MEVSEAYPQTHTLSSVGQTRSHQCRGVLQSTGGGGVGVGWGGGAVVAERTRVPREKPHVSAGQA